MRGYRALLVPATSLVTTLALAHAEGRLEEQLLHFTKPKLLVVDELGYLPFESNTAHLFFQRVGLRDERGSMLVTSNRSVAECGGVFGDAVVATAILGRLLRYSQVSAIRGDNDWLRKKREPGIDNELIINRGAELDVVRGAVLDVACHGSAGRVSASPGADGLLTTSHHLPGSAPLPLSRRAQRNCRQCSHASLLRTGCAMRPRLLPRGIASREATRLSIHLVISRSTQALAPSSATCAGLQCARSPSAPGCGPAGRSRS